MSEVEWIWQGCSGRESLSGLNVWVEAEEESKWDSARSWLRNDHPLE